MSEAPLQGPRSRLFKKPEIFLGTVRVHTREQPLFLYSALVIHLCNGLGGELGENSLE